MSDASMRPVAGVPGVDFSIEDVRGGFPDELEIVPLERPVDATVQVPGSKSLTNRALLVAALADGHSTIKNPLLSDDSYWLMDALVRLGFSVEADRGGGFATIQGRAGIIPERDVDLYVGNAGTVARFLPPTLTLGEGPYRVDGVSRMRERPVGDLVEAMRGLGAGVEYGGEEGKFPLILDGGGLQGGVARVKGSKSSQFLSGLLMAAPYAAREVVLEVEGGLVSTPYVGITVEIMSEFGIEAEVGEYYGRFTISPGSYRARDYAIEPDASGASYFLAAAAVTGGRVEIAGLGTGSMQGDMRFTEVLAEMGCEVQVRADRVSVRGPERLRGVEVDMNAFSDTMMTLAAIAPFAEGPTTIKNVEHTRHQETDRISAVVTELTRLGVRAEEWRDGLRIESGPVHPALVRTYHDHRVAMAFAVTGLVTPGICIQNPGCVTKTFPDYFQRLDLLR